MKLIDLKHTLAGLTCATMMVASLAACGGSDDKATLPVHTGGASPSATTTSRPTTTAPTATAAGPVALVPHATYTYGGLKVVVDQPANIAKASRPSMRLFSEFLQADGRTMARNTLDPVMTDLASADVVKYVKATTGGESVQGIGSVAFTISKVHSAGSDYTLITGCTDQSKLVQVRKDGSQYVDPNTKKYPKLKMTADINRSTRGLRVTAFTFVAGTC